MSNNWSPTPSSGQYVLSTSLRFLSIPARDGTPGPVAPVESQTCQALNYFFDWLGMPKFFLWSPRQILVVRTLRRVWHRVCAWLDGISLNTQVPADLAESPLPWTFASVDVKYDAFSLSCLYRFFPKQFTFCSDPPLCPNLLPSRSNRYC